MLHATGNLFTVIFYWLTKTFAKIKKIWQRVLPHEFIYGDDITSAEIGCLLIISLVYKR
jgi:hypothetical protein